MDEKKRNQVLHQNNATSNAITKESIEIALIQLMEEKEFENITITDITKKAGVSRLAYYRNYASKEDILSGFLQTIIADFYETFKQYDAIHETQLLWYAIFHKVKEHSTQLKLLIRAGYSATILQEYIKGINAPFENVNDNPKLYYSNCYWVGALHAMTQEWLLNDMKVEIDEMVEIGVSMMQKGIQTIEEYGNRAEKLK